jgi:hypothetical protein
MIISPSASEKGAVAGRQSYHSQQSALEQLVVLAGDRIDMGEPAAGQGAEGNQWKDQPHDDPHVQSILPSTITQMAPLLPEPGNYTRSLAARTDGLMRCRGSQERGY